MESPVRIKISVAVVLMLLFSIGFCNGYPKEENKEQNIGSFVENSTEATTYTPRTEKTNNTIPRYNPRNITRRYQRKDTPFSYNNSTTSTIISNATDARNTTLDNSAPSTSRIFFRGSTKFYTTKPPFKPKIPHMRRNFTRFNNIDANNSIDTSTESTIQRNEVFTIQKLKEVKLNETLEKLREAMVTSKPKEAQNNNTSAINTQTTINDITLVPSNRSEGIKSWYEEFNIDKYVSDDFHDINNVYSQSVSPEIEHFIIPENVSDYFVSVGSKPHVKSTSSDYLIARTTPLTTPRADYFDRRFKEVSESIKQNLADVDMDYANDENTTPDDEESNVNFDEILTKPLDNNSNLMYKNTREITLTNSKDKNNRQSNYDGTNGTQIVYEVSTISTNKYEHVSIKTITPEAENIKYNEITTIPSRNSKSSSSETIEYRTEPSIERRSDHFRTNSSRKEYLTTIRMRSRTTPKPRIRISLKNNRNSPNATQDSDSKESVSINKVAEVVKMQPYTRSRATLSTSSSKIDPIAITASDAIERFVSSLSKRGSTKHAEDFNETISKTANDSTSSFSIPPTATAWALIKFKDVPIAKKDVSPISVSAFADNSIKSESDEINTVNSTLVQPVLTPKYETSTFKKTVPTMDVGESNIEIVTSINIITTVTTPQPTTTTAKISKTPLENSINSVEIDTSVSPVVGPIAKLSSMATTILETIQKSTTNYMSKSTTSTTESNEVFKNDNNLTTQVIVDDSNTTSTVGTESNTESDHTTENVTEVPSTTENEIVSLLDSKGDDDILSTTSVSDYNNIFSTTIQSNDFITTSSKVEVDSETESTKSTKSFIDEYPTTVKPEDENKSHQITTEIVENIKTTTMNPDDDDLDDFNFSSMLSKTDSPTEASGDVEETTLHNISENPTTVNYPSTTLAYSLTQPTTVTSKLSTSMSQKPTTRYLTTLTTSLLPFSEDTADSRESKNKIISEEEDKINNEDDWIDPDASNDTKNVDSNEIPIHISNKTESDAIEMEDNNADNEIPKIGRNDSVLISTSTTQSNIEVVQRNRPEMNAESGERESKETTTIFTEDNVGEFDAVNGSGAIAAITISAIGIVALLLLIGILLVARGRRQGGGYGQRCTPVSLDSYSLDNVSVNGSSRRKGRRASKRSYGNPAYDEAGATSHPMQFAALANFALDSESMMNEFNDIPMIHARTDEIPPGCESKNRFSNVIPLPETRVSLKLLPGDETSDYINGNYVRGPKCLKKYYIACQAPMAATVNDFWRMIWEQNSRVVLMLTEFMENGMEKCFEYIPLSEVSDNRRTFGDYQIIIKKRDIRDKYVISQLQLKNLVTRTWREITHMWYFWPAKGVPEECHSVIAFLLEARSYLKASQNAKEYDEDGHDSMITHNGSYANNVNVMENEEESEVNIYNVQRGEKTSNGNSKTGTLSHSDGTMRGGPMVVHCSPGTGRTGAVIACDIGIRDFEMSRTVDVPKTVYRIRRDRANSVQTKDQYIFIYKVLSEYATKLTGGVLDSI